MYLILIAGYLIIGICHGIATTPRFVKCMKAQGVYRRGVTETGSIICSMALWPMFLLIDLFLKM